VRPASSSSEPADRAEASALIGLARIFGLLDSAAPLGYLAFGNALPVEIAALTLKALALLVMARALRPQDVPWAFAATLFLLTTSGAVVGQFTGAFSSFSLLQYTAFSGSLVMTMIVLARGHLLTYCRWALPIPVGVAAFHVASSLTGTAPLANGRFDYVGGTHPNLGGEIAAVTALAASLALRPRLALPLMALLFASCTLMQSRAAMVAIALLAVILVARGAARRLGWLLLPVLLVMAPFAIGVWAWLGTDPFALLAENLLRLDDPDRGILSGFAGREARWAIGFDDFRRDVLFGNGIGTFENGLESPHNAFLYGLAMHGIVSVAFWGFLAAALARVLAARPDQVALMAALGLLLVFNDRFFNLNPYPFEYYVMILCAPAALAVARQRQRVPGREPAAALVTTPAPAVVQP
jgi:hypothetical protein